MSAAPDRRDAAPAGLTDLERRYASVRAQTEALAAPLSEADAQVQSMPDASPTKWHLAHTTWFFETFVLERHETGFVPHDPAYRVLFNSYYQGVGRQHPRPQRGLVTRPGLAAVRGYRHAVDERMRRLLRGQALDGAALALVELGLQHEQQHQELILTDLKHLLSCNPTDPVYLPPPPRRARVRAADAAPGWCAFEGGTVGIGHTGGGFAFDNESPRHDVLLRPYALARNLVTHAQWQAFIDDGGYRDPRWWLAAGWDWLRAQQVEAPAYWRREEDTGSGWSCFTLHGRRPLDADAPVTHVSLYEADAYAHWQAAQTGEPCRLPTEAEWEHAGSAQAPEQITAGHFVDGGTLHPTAPAGTPRDASPQQLFGDVWEWTSSSYAPYPGFRTWEGAVGEYNGKFMINQYVLRGGSCATPRDHIRATYRNFFPADARWQFSGVRLARDLG